MTDLIPRDAALSFVNSKVTNSGYSILGIRIEQGINAIPAIDPAAIREAALREALKSLRDWQAHLNRHSSKETAITVGMAADVVEAMIGEKK